MYDEGINAMLCTHVCDGAGVTPGFLEFLELHRSEANLDSANDDK